VLLSSLLEKIASIRVGSSLGANARLISRPHARVARSIKGNELGDGQHSVQSQRRWGGRRTTMGDRTSSGGVDGH